MISPIIKEIPPFERALRAGMMGDDVTMLKKRLCDLGLLDKNALENNIFGMATKRAVESFQLQKCLRKTGRVDEKTHREIFAFCKTQCSDIN